MNEAGAIFRIAEGIPGLLEPSSQHRLFFEKIPEYIQSDKLKIAVVGAIKSGKSTFVNSFLGKELVKRGAGVVTSITTRIQKGKKKQAWLYLRSWNDINTGLRKLLVMVPDHLAGKEFVEDFDIRNKNNRETLRNIYQHFTKIFPAHNETIHPEILTIRHAFQGFEDLKDLIQSDEAIICLESKAFEKHKEYTGDPDKAFYIRDVCLFAPVSNLDSSMEIADCQGSDSTDPSQLSKILAYLEFANLMIYCISSRTGLRESDMVFLKRIKNLGLLDNMIFINNCDLAEHESLDDLIKVEAGIREDLSLLGIKPELYSFSFLYNHFSYIKSKISKKDLFRFESWQSEKKMVGYCDRKTREFNLYFNDKIEKNRKELLISNHMKRLFILLRDLVFRIDIFFDLLSCDTAKEEKARRALSDFYQNAYRIETIAANSLENAVQNLKKEISINIHQMFNQDKDAVLKDLHEYVQILSIEVESYNVHEGTTGFNEALFLSFKEFHRRVDLYVLEAVKPLLKKFIRFQEDRIKSFFQSYIEYCHADLLPFDIYSGDRDMLLSKSQRMVAVDVDDIDEIKKILGIQIPDRVVEAQYTPKIKTKTIMEFTLKTALQFFSSLLDKQPQFSFSPALKDAFVKMKAENHKIFKRQFEDYGNDLKIQYFFPLIDSSARSFKEKTNERFKQYEAFNIKTDQLFFLKQSEKEDKKNIVISLKQKIEILINSINSFANS
ncbi:MAG: dynamin family protein [Desulfobacula sp.]